MGSQYLIDTNAVIDYLGKKLPPSGMSFLHTVVDQIPNLSIISKIEVLGYKLPADSYEVLRGFINDSHVLMLSDDIAERSIELRKQQKIKLPDAIIAATALVYNFEIITRNTADFKNIIGLTVIDPWNTSFTLK